MDGKATAAEEEHDVHARRMPGQVPSSAEYPTAISRQANPLTPRDGPFFASYFLAPTHTPALAQAAEAATLLTQQKGPGQLPFQWENWKRLWAQLLPLQSTARSSSARAMGESIHLSRRAPAHLGFLPGIVLLILHPTGRETEAAPARKPE